MTNNEIRRKAASEGIKLWEIADALGIADCSLSRKLRHELPLAEKGKMLAIIDKLAKEKEG